jgi:stress response protein YsnF
MKDIYKNPLFYYLVVLVIAFLWPAIIWGIYLPASRARYNSDEEQYKKAQQVMEELLTVDPERLDAAKDKTAASGFDYATAVQQAAQFASIPATNPRLSTQPVATSEGQKSQSANISLEDVDITKAARFLSTLQLRWSGLQCTKVTLRKKKGLPDSWDVDFAFKYFY